MFYVTEREAASDNMTDMLELLSRQKDKMLVLQNMTHILWV